MFNLFKKRSKVEILQKEYMKLLQRSRELSTSDRAASDLTFAKAQEVLKEMDRLADADANNS